MNFKSIFVALVTLMLGLGMIGCAVKETDTAAEKAGKYVVNSPIYALGLIDAGATLLMAPIIMPVGGIIKGFKNIDDGDYGSAVVIEDVNKSFFDTNSSYELLTESNGVYFYSAEGLPENKFIVVMECDDNKAMAMEADGVYIAKNSGAKDKGFCRNIVRSPGMPINKNMNIDKFKGYIEKDSFGRGVWIGNDLLLCANCKSHDGKYKYVVYIEKARNKDANLEGVYEAMVKSKKK